MKNPSISIYRSPKPDPASKPLAVILCHILLVACSVGSLVAADITPTARIELFNGKDLTGWRSTLQDGAEASTVWSVQDGTLRCTGTPNGYLRTETTWTDYHLTVEWRWTNPKGGNSGMFLHLTGSDKIWPKTFECQGAHGHQGEVFAMGTKATEMPEKGGMKSLDAGAENPLGEWNKYEAVCKGDTIVVLLNGKEVNRLGGCVPVSGAVGLQSENGSWEARRVTMEPLGSESNELPMMAKLTKITPEIVAKIAAACPTKPIVTPKKPRKILIFSRSDGFVHPSTSVGEKALVMMGESTGAYTANVSYDYGDFDRANLANYDAIVFNNTGGTKFPKGATREALLDFVHSGKGIVGIHAAVDNFQNFPEARAMMGAVFAGHPWGGGTWRFKVEEAEHPITRVLDPAGFSFKDEIYQYDEKLSGRHNLRVLVTLDLSDPVTLRGSDNGVKQIRTDGDNPAVWVRQEGKGRVFVNGFGHHNETHWHPTMLALNLAGIQYAVGDLEADDTLLPKK